jgi:glutamate transport system permease protein
VGLIELASDNSDLLLRYTWTTLSLATLSYLMAFVIGNVVAAMRLSPVPVLQSTGSLYTSFFRNLPLLVLAVLFWVGGGRAGWPFNRFWTVVVVLGMYTGAYVAEAVRSGVNAVPPGQAEAARAIGLPFSGVAGRIVIPQAIRTVIPPLGNLWIANLKNTSVFLVIGINELTRGGRQIGQANADFVSAFLIVGFIYVVLVYGSAQLFKLIERRVEIAR